MYLDSIKCRARSVVRVNIQNADPRVSEGVRARIAGNSREPDLLPDTSICSFAFSHFGIFAKCSDSSVVKDIGLKSVFVFFFSFFFRGYRWGLNGKNLSRENVKYKTTLWSKPWRCKKKKITKQEETRISFERASKKQDDPQEMYYS